MAITYYYQDILLLNLVPEFHCEKLFASHLVTVILRPLTQLLVLSPANKATNCLAYEMARS